MKAILTIIISTLFVINSVAQTKQEYIYQYAPIAVSEMEIARIPASITLAQGLIESRYGTSQLSKRSNNHFGIKCHKNWGGGKVYHDDDARNECFRSYNDPYLSYQDHSEFLNTRKRYSFLFQLDIRDYKGWAKGLKLAGYATDPNYANKLIKIIEDYKLYQFDSVSSAEVVDYVQQLQGGKKPVQYVSAPSKPSRTVTQKQPTKSVSKRKQTIGGPAASPENAQPYSRKEFSVNQVKAVHSFAGDSPKALAEKYKISESRLSNYNEWDKYRSEFYYGMNVYLQPKRSKSRDVKVKFHKVKASETMYQIAQNYGLKTSSLYALNRMDENKREQPRRGERIYLRKKRKTRPNLRNKSAVRVPTSTAQKTTKKKNVVQTVKKKVTSINTPRVSLSKPKVKKANPTETTHQPVETKVQKVAKPVNTSVVPSTKKTEVKTETTATPVKQNEVKKAPVKTVSAPSRPVKMPSVDDSKTGVVTIETPDPFGQATVHHTPANKERKRIKVPQSQTPSVTRVVERTPVNTTPAPTQVIEQKPVQPTAPPTQNQVVTKEVVYVYPNQDVKQVKPVTKTEEQHEGRAIIYDPTPAVNSTPVKVYQPEPTRKVVEQKPVPQKQVNTPVASSKKIHKVVKGDTLYSLSRKYGVSVKQLQTWNKLSSSGIKIGQKLIVKQ